MAAADYTSANSPVIYPSDWAPLTSETLSQTLRRSLISGAELIDGLLLNFGPSAIHPCRLKTLRFLAGFGQTPCTLLYPTPSCIDPVLCDSGAASGLAEVRYVLFAVYTTISSRAQWPQRTVLTPAASSRSEVFICYSSSAFPPRTTQVSLILSRLS